jgi:hypothetical protein
MRDDLSSLAGKICCRHGVVGALDEGIEERLWRMLGCSIVVWPAQQRAYYMTSWTWQWHCFVSDSMLGQRCEQDLDLVVSAVQQQYSARTSFAAAREALLRYKRHQEKIFVSLEI